MGDLNGHVGVNRHGIEDIIGAFGIGDSNPDGERIVEFCIRNQMVIMNTFFNHRPEHKWTWYRWNAEREEYSQKSMIDLVLTSRKSLVHDVKAISSLSLDSDHRVVVCKINHQPPPILKRPCKQRIKVERLQEEAVKRDLEARLSNIQLPERETTLETMWQEIKGDLLKIAEEVVGVKWIGGTKKKRSAYWTEEVREAVANKNRAFRRWLKVRTEESRQRYVNLRNTDKTIQNRARDNAWRNIGEDLEKDVEVTRKLLFSMAKSYRKGGNEQQFSVKNTTGELLTEPEKVDERWEEYFRNLLNAPENGGTAEEEEEEEVASEEHLMGDMVDRITVSDVKDALLKMPNNKAAGYDGIPCEIFKFGGMTAINILTRLFNIAWDAGEIPQDWSKAVIHPVFKKGDRTNCSNYRGIALLSHVGKIYERILEKKLRNIVEDVLHEAQHGFRPGRGTTDLVFALKMILEKSWEWDIKKYVALLDLEKAFDRVPRQMLWRAMRRAEYQIPPKLERAIKSLYASNETLVRPVAKEEKWFDVSSGVRQGSVISPLLFILLMDQVVKVVEQRSGDRGNYATFIYADDVGLVEEDLQQFSNMINLWNNVLKEHGLKINLGKTELMLAGREQEEIDIQIEDVKLKQVTEVKYLGVAFDEEVRNEKTIEDRIANYSKNVNLLYPLLKDRHVPRKVKKIIYKTILRPILTYGCECWTLTSKTRSKIQAAEMRVLRIIKGVTRRDRMRNEDIRKELYIDSILIFVERAQLRWYGHVMRMEENRTPNRWLNWRPRGRRPLGRPRKRWCDNINEALRNRGSSLQQVLQERRYDDRADWRRLTQTDRLT